MSVRFLSRTFEDYQMARANFVQAIADASTSSLNMDFLEKTSVIDLLKPLVTDIVPTIQQNAALALGRIAGISEKLSKVIIQKGILPELFTHLGSEKRLNNLSLILLRAMCKHSAKLAEDVVEAGGVDFAVECMKDHQATIKEPAACVLGYIGRHSLQHALSVIDGGAIPVLLKALQDPKPCLKQVAANALGDISKHGRETVEPIISANSLPVLKSCLANQDAVLKRSVLHIISNICKQSEEFVDDVIRNDLLPDILEHLKYDDAIVQKNSASVLREMIKHSYRLAEIVVSHEAIEKLLDLLENGSKCAQMHTLIALGYVASLSSLMAIEIVNKGGDHILLNLLFSQTSDPVLCALVWCLGQVAKHSPEHAKVISETQVIGRLLELSNGKNSSNDLKAKTKDSVKLIIQRCLAIETVSKLLNNEDAYYVKLALNQIVKLLTGEDDARCKFLTCGGFKRVQELKVNATQAEPPYEKEIELVNLCYPAELTNYYSYDVPEHFLDAAEQFVPNLSDFEENDLSFAEEGE